jgi:hypothetical protein|tara:strand:- start:1023 stop:1199 length:177 start_codon:yes stop_codon:yes gene_type:complete
MDSIFVGNESIYEISRGSKKEWIVLAKDIFIGPKEHPQRIENRRRIPKRGNNIIPRFI